MSGYGSGSVVTWSEVTMELGKWFRYLAEFQQLMIDQGERLGAVGSSLAERMQKRNRM